MEFHENYKKFINRIIEHSKVFLLSVFVAFWGGYTLTGNALVCLCIACLLVLIIIIYIYKWSVIFIEIIDINNNEVYLKIYQYDAVVVNSTFKKNELMCSLELVSSSKRGSSYKLDICIKDKIYSQYETMGWTKSKFDHFLKEYNNLED
jgi:hypothetical protein